MDAEILIVDDDPLVGNLTQEILSDAGYSTRLVTDSHLVLEAVESLKPRLVLLDILMPGIDGISLLHQIKSRGSLSGVKVAVVSAKSFKSEVERAKSLGADEFIRKPYDIRGLPAQIERLIGGPSGAGGGRGAALRLKARGAREADSTPSLSVEASNRLFLLDAGRGAVALGQEALDCGFYREAWLLISHFHPDHVSGLGLLPLLRSEDFLLHVLGPGEPDKNLSAQLREAVGRTMKGDPRPITAKIQVHEMRESLYELAPGVRISPFYANHPTTTLAYLLEVAGRRVVYCPDGELYGEGASALQDYDEKISRVCRGADLLVLDARWTDEDYEAHRDEGHSAVSSAAEFAADCEARRLLLIHADSSYPDSRVEEMVQRARETLEDRGARIPCDAVRDGLILEF
jgi:CheY-like chemotaxis protein